MIPKEPNPDAAIKGISAMTKPTILLGGGYDKKSTYENGLMHSMVKYDISL